MVFPCDGGTYGTNADGSLVPFTALGYADASGATVTLYEDNTSALLGSTVASSTPDAVGDYAGWYPWSIFVSSWSASAGLAAPAVTASATAGGVSLTAALTVPAATATSSAGGIIASSTTLQLFPAASATAAAGGVSVAGVGSIPAATATGAAGGISIAESGATPAYSADFTSTPLSNFDVIPASAAWFVSSGTMVQQGSANGSALVKASLVSAFLNGAVEARVKFPSANANPWLMARCPNTDPWGTSAGDWIAVVLNGAGVHLYDREGGVGLSLAAEHLETLSANTFYTLKMAFSGSTVTVYLGGVLVITATVVNGVGFGVSGVGVTRAGGSTETVTFDDLKVWNA